MKKLQMHYCSKKQMSESFLTAAFLSVSGGLQDMYTYISRGHVFANAQTGNIVLLSQHIFAENWADVMRYLMPVLSFMFGVAAATEIRQHFQNIGRIHWRQIVILIEMSMLFLVGFLPGKWIWWQMLSSHFPVPCRYRRFVKLTVMHLQAPCVLEISAAEWKHSVPIVSHIIARFCTKLFIILESLFYLHLEQVLAVF